MLNDLSFLLTYSSLLFVSLFQRTAPTTVNHGQGKDGGCSWSWPVGAFLLMSNWHYKESLNGDLTDARDGWWIPFKPKSQQFFHRHLQSRKCYGKGKGGINSHLTGFYYNPWSSVIGNLCNLPLVTVWCFLTFLTKTNNPIWAYGMPKNRQTFQTHTSTALHMKQPFIDIRQYQISSQ